jgi:hypothetical protein
MLANRQPSFCDFSTLTETMRMSITIQFPCRETIPHDVVYMAKNAGFLEHEYLCLKHDPIGPLGPHLITQQVILVSTQQITLWRRGWLLSRVFRSSWWRQKNGILQWLCHKSTAKGVNWGMKRENTIRRSRCGERSNRFMTLFIKKSLNTGPCSQVPQLHGSMWVPWQTCNTIPAHY